MTFCKNRLFVIVCLVLFVVEMVDSIVKVLGTKSTAFSLGVLTADKVEFYSDKKGNIIVLQCDDNKTIIRNQSKSEEVILNSEYDFSQKCDNFIYLFKSEDDPSDDEFLRMLSVVVYSVTKNEIIARNSFNIASCNYNDFAVLKNGCFCVVSSNFRKNVFTCRCANGKLSAHALKQNVECINSNDDGSRVYVQFSDKSIVVFDSKLKKIADVSIDAESLVEFLNEDIVVDMMGQVYVSSVKGNYDFVPFVKLNHASDKICVSDGYIVYTDINNNINFVNATSAEEYAGLKIDGEVKYLAKCNDGIVCVFEKDDETFIRKISIDDAINSILKSESDVNLLEDLLSSTKSKEKVGVSEDFSTHAKTDVSEKLEDDCSEEDKMKNMESQDAISKDGEKVCSEEGLEKDIVDDMKAKIEEKSLDDDQKIDQKSVEMIDENLVDMQSDLSDSEKISSTTIESEDVRCETAKLISENTFRRIKALSAKRKLEDSASSIVAESLRDASDVVINLSGVNSERTSVKVNELAEVNTGSLNTTDEHIDVKSESAKIIVKNTLKRVKALSTKRKCGFSGSKIEMENVVHVNDFMKVPYEIDSNVKDADCAKISRSVGNDVHTVLPSKFFTGITDSLNVKSITAKLFSAEVKKRENQLRIRCLNNGKCDSTSTITETESEDCGLAESTKNLTKPVRSRRTCDMVGKTKRDSRRTVSKIKPSLPKMQMNEVKTKSVTIPERLSTTEEKVVNFSEARKPRYAAKRTNCYDETRFEYVKTKNLRTSGSIEPSDTTERITMSSVSRSVPEKGDFDSVKLAVKSAVNLAKRKSENKISDLHKNNGELMKCYPTSELYRLDFSKKRIYGVDRDTTISAFKKNLNLFGYNARFSKNGNIIKSGKIGTNTTVTFFSDNHDEISLVAVVPGDLTGTGGVSKKDLKEMYRHIFGVKYLSGVYFEAADLNGDGVVDTLDLLLLSKFLCF